MQGGAHRTPHQRVKGDQKHPRPNAVIRRERPRRPLVPAALAAILVAPSTAGAAPGPAAPPAKPARVVLDDFEGNVAQRWQNLKPSRAPVKRGKASGRWADLTDAVNLKLPHDWSRYEKWTLTVWCHSAKATQARFAIMLSSDTDATQGPDFYYHLVTVDWTGWKQIRVPLQAFKAWDQPGGFGHIEAVAFNTSVDWVGTAKVPGTLLHFDDLALEDSPN